MGPRLSFFYIEFKVLYWDLKVILNAHEYVSRTLYEFSIVNISMGNPPPSLENRLPGSLFLIGLKT